MDRGDATVARARQRAVAELAGRHHARLVRTAHAVAGPDAAEDAVQDVYRALLSARTPTPADGDRLLAYAIVATRRAALRQGSAEVVDPDAVAAAPTAGLGVERAALARVFLEAWFRAAAAAPHTAGRVVVADALDVPRAEIAASQERTVRGVRRDLERHRDRIRQRALAALGHARDSGPAGIFAGALVRLRELPLLAKAATAVAVSALPVTGLVELRSERPTQSPPPRVAPAAPPAPRLLAPRIVLPARLQPLVLPPPLHRHPHARPHRPAPRPRPRRRHVTPPAAPTTVRVPVPGIVDAEKELPAATPAAPLGEVALPGL